MLFLSVKIVTTEQLWGELGNENKKFHGSQRYIREVLTLFFISSMNL